MSWSLNRRRGALRAAVFIVSEWCRQFLYHTKYVFPDLDNSAEVPKNVHSPMHYPGPSTRKNGGPHTLVDGVTGRRPAPP
jgi:hypothetical protein